MVVPTGVTSSAQLPTTTPLPQDAKHAVVVAADAVSIGVYETLEYQMIETVTVAVIKTIGASEAAMHAMNTTVITSFYESHKKEDIT